MKDINIPVGVSDFKKIRENHAYYIDKSGLILKLLREDAAEVTLITRPRRFGKTLGMSMLASFFDIRQNNAALFNGLEISNHTELCKKWMNQYPVLFLTFKDVDGTSFEHAFEMLKFTISQVCSEHAYLEQSNRVSDMQKEIFARLKNQTASFTEVKNSIFILIKMMQAHYGRPVIFLLDEYDVPVAKASSSNYYPQMLEVIKAIMSTTLKDNPALHFAVITGCLKVAKESIFTGTYNFVSDTIVSCGLNEYFGFTPDDVNLLLKDAGAEEYAAKIKEWYDGYHFGNFDIYCPWDVMNYLRDLKNNPNAKPASYWKNTSDNAIIRSFIDYAGNTITLKLETLMSGGSITQKIEENLTYDYLHSSEDNLWNILYLTGYLTRIRETNLPAPLPEGVSALVIPNAEIREIFENVIIKWFDDSAKTWNRKALFDSVWSADDKIITEEMTRLLRKTISYHDYKEDFYHAFLAGIFAGAGFMVESNKEHGEGRSDVVVYDSANGRVAIFEVKYSKALKDMSTDCDKALHQINEQMYAREYEDDFDHILCYGISFFKKRCLVRKK